jgi:D-proline reductase (dithiol) PrdB
MPRLDRIPQLTRNMLLTRAVEVNADSPWVVVSKRLSESRVALVTTAGVHLRDDEPFGLSDPSFRVIPAGSTQADLLQSHSSIGSDRSAVMQDINVTFPIDRIRTMVEDGRIGSLAANHYSFMGAQLDGTLVKEKTSRVVAQKLVDAKVDVVLLTPT